MQTYKSQLVLWSQEVLQYKWSTIIINIQMKDNLQMRNNNNNKKKKKHSALYSKGDKV